MSTQSAQANLTANQGSIQLSANTHAAAHKSGNANHTSITLANSGASQVTPHSPAVIADLASATFALLACLMALVIAKYKLRQWLLG
jgi:hypothetical protein